jgi:hypothetical protein
VHRYQPHPQTKRKQKEMLSESKIVEEAIAMVQIRFIYEAIRREIHRRRPLQRPVGNVMNDQQWVAFQERVAEIVGCIERKSNLRVDRFHPGCKNWCACEEHYMVVMAKYVMYLHILGWSESEANERTAAQLGFSLPSLDAFPVQRYPWRNFHIGYTEI